MSRRDKVYDFIVAYKKKHDGNSPTHEEIKDAVGLKSKSSVNWHLSQLVKAGLIEMPHYGGTRFIAVVGGRWKLEKQS